MLKKLWKARGGAPHTPAADMLLVSDDPAAALDAAAVEVGAAAAQLLSPAAARPTAAVRPATASGGAAAATAFELFSRDGGIFDEAGRRVSIKGVNWFGLETHNFALHGLWSVGLEETLDFVAQVCVCVGGGVNWVGFRLAAVQQPQHTHHTPLHTPTSTTPPAPHHPSTSTPSACPSRASWRSPWTPSAPTTSTTRQTLRWRD
jgi:hypothetical protein